MPKESYTGNENNEKISAELEKKQFDIIVNHILTLSELYEFEKSKLKPLVDTNLYREIEGTDTSKRLTSSVVEKEIRDENNKLISYSVEPIIEIEYLLKDKNIGSYISPLNKQEISLIYRRLPRLNKEFDKSAIDEVMRETIKNGIIFQIKKIEEAEMFDFKTKSGEIIKIGEKEIYLLVKELKKLLEKYKEVK